MERKKEKVVGLLFIGFTGLMLGIVSYGAFSQLKPKDPVKILFQASEGNVLFDMKEHASDEGYGIECTLCHHDYDESEGGRPGACRSTDCHGGEDNEEAPKPEEAFHGLCTGCHEEDGTAPADCTDCHVP